MTLQDKAAYLKSIGWKQCMPTAKGKRWEHAEWPASMYKPMYTTSAYSAQKMLERRVK